MVFIAASVSYSYDAVVEVSFSQLQSEHNQQIALLEPSFKLGTSPSGSQIGSSTFPDSFIGTISSSPYIGLMGMKILIEFFQLVLD